MSDVLWSEQRRVIDSAIAEIQNELATTNPSLRWSTGCGRPQPVFPFRTYASIALDDRADDIDSIDFSVDCKLEEEGQLRISSAIC